MFIVPNRQKSIKVGFISDLSGAFQWPAEAQLKGVALAVREINKEGGIKGRRVEIVKRDTELDEALTAKRTRELIEKEKADFIIGGIKAPLHQIINKETKKAGIIFMSIGQTEELTQVEHLGPYTFHQAVTPYMTAQGAGAWMLENIGRKCFVITMDYSWGWHFAESFTNLVNRVGGKILGIAKIPFPAKDGDHAKHFSKIKKLKPEVLLVGNFGQQQVHFIQEAGKANLKRHMSIVNALSETNIMAKLDPETIAGMYWGGTFYWGLEQNLETAKHFVSSYGRLFHELPSGYAAYGYSGTLEVLHAARKIGEYHLDPAKISQELEGRTYAHYKTPEWWRPCDHQAFQDFYIFKMKGPEERKSKDDIAETLGASSWNLDFERSCETLGHEKRLWGHIKK